MVLLNVLRNKIGVARFRRGRVSRPSKGLERVFTVARAIYVHGNGNGARDWVRRVERPVINGDIQCGTNTVCRISYLG